MLNSLTHTQRDPAQKGASSASKSILPAVNIQVMAPTYHGKACGSHATLSSESGSINYFQMHSIQSGDLEPLNLQIFVLASLSASPGNSSLSLRIEFSLEDQLKNAVVQPIFAPAGAHA
jgi:hypothetical protein